MFSIFFRIILQQVLVKISSVPPVLHRNTGEMHRIKSSILAPFFAWVSATYLNFPVFLSRCLVFL